MWRTKLMAIDDDEDVARLICKVAQNIGFDCRNADGIGAYDACLKFQPDIIVLDIFMPEIDGFEVLRYLSLSDKQPAVIILSGKDYSYREMAKRMCEQLGLMLVANLAKPYKISELEEILRSTRKERLSKIRHRQKKGEYMSASVHGEG